MKTKIAVFGRKEVVDQCHSSVLGQVDLEIVPFIYTHVNETPKLIEKAFICDVYLFTEAISYAFVKKIINKKRLPAVQIPCDDYMFLTSLFLANNEREKPIKRLSIDLWNKHRIHEVLTKLNTSNYEVYTSDYRNNEDNNIDQITAFHKQLWEKGKIDHVLTSIKEVDLMLKDANIPSTCMEIPKVNIERAIQKCKSIATLKKYNHTQMIAGYVCVKGFELLNREKGEITYEMILPKLDQLLEEFTFQTEAALIQTKANQYVLFGTQKMIHYITDHYRNFPLLTEIERSLQVPISIGFGLGMTVKQAENNAKLALDRCNQEPSSHNCFLVNEQGDSFGPIGVKKHFDAAQLYQALIHKARLNNELSYNFINFISSRNNEPFSSNDIALYYRVTKRSAERTINKLLNGKVIKVVGEEKPYLKGRPRKLFQIATEKEKAR
ncbi:MAG TPA: hypothetical protein VK105_05275 [Virgibacillus sp.]|nr:hypothetical protein [Virgibacillus sp.]HLR66540.1 hypothetical protein [Virgibacillus sp.]